MRILGLAAGLSAVATLALAGPLPVVIDPIKGGPILIDAGEVVSFDQVQRMPVEGLGPSNETLAPEAGPVAQNGGPGTSGGPTPHLPVVGINELQVPALSVDGATRALARLDGLKQRAPAGSPQAIEVLTLARAVIAALPADQQAAALARFGLTQ